MIPANATVRHATFGLGLVLASTEQRITVQFDDGSTRTLVPALARLECVSASERPRRTQSATPRVRKAPAARSGQKPNVRRKVPIYPHHCQACGGDWMGDVAHPKYCHLCKSPYWAGRTPDAPTQYPHHCHQCGNDWTGKVAQPDQCPRCWSKHWSDPNYVMAECMRRRGERKRARAMREERAA